MAPEVETESSRRTESRQTPESRRLAKATSPRASQPMRAARRTSAPNLDRTAAVLAAQPPAKIWRSSMKSVVPRAGKASTDRTTTSATSWPTHRMDLPEELVISGAKALDIGADPFDAEKIEKQAGLLADVRHGDGEVMGKAAIDDHAMKFLGIFDRDVCGDVFDAFGGIDAAFTAEDEDFKAAVWLGSEAKAGFAAKFVLTDNDRPHGFARE